MMNITKTVEGEKLTVALEGRLDTLTAPELEESLSSALEGIKELVLDLSGLEYLSSAYFLHFSLIDLLFFLVRITIFIMASTEISSAKHMISVSLGARYFNPLV